MKKLIQGVITLAFACQATAGTILITEYDFGPTAYTDMEANLEAAGHTVDRVDAKVSGNIAAALATGIYDQVFLYDLTSTAYMSAGDATALSTFWGAHSGLVIDTRSYGYFFNGNDASEVSLLQNVATNLDLSGGGVWVGTDHNPEWTRNANVFLDEIGVNQVVGSFSDAVNFNDPASVLLSGVTTTDLWGGGASVGRAPLGLQPNGIEMFIHFGHENAATGEINPYISANFDLAGPDPDPDPDPDPISEPSLLMIFGLSVLGMTTLRRRKSSK